MIICTHIHIYISFYFNQSVDVYINIHEFIPTFSVSGQHHWAFLVAQKVKNLPAMWETWLLSLGWEDPLDEGMATHSWVVFLPGESPRTEEPGRLQSMGLQKVGHNWVTKHTSNTIEFLRFVPFLCLYLPSLTVNSSNCIECVYLFDHLPHMQPGFHCPGYSLLCMEALLTLLGLATLCQMTLPCGCFCTLGCDTILWVAFPHICPYSLQFLAPWAGPFSSLHPNPYWPIYLLYCTLCPSSTI